jgi:hypothetical protein
MIAERLLERFLLIGRSFRLLIFVGSEKDGAEESSFDGGSVYDDGILLVVSGVAENGNNRIDAGGQLSEAQVLHGACRDQRFLRVLQDVGQSVHPDVEVGNVHSHGLFTHGALVSVTRRLVVIGKRNNRGANSQNHGRMNLAMRVRRTVGVFTLDKQSKTFNGWMGWGRERKNQCRKFTWRKSSGDMAIMAVSSSKVSMYSTTPVATSSCQLKLMYSRCLSMSTWRFFSNNLQFSTINNGRQIRPASV